MPEILFKCETCGEHLTSETAGAGGTAPCPSCDASVCVPKDAAFYSCPHCKSQSLVARNMLGVVFPCPSCLKEVQLPNTPSAVRASRFGQTVKFAYIALNARGNEVEGLIDSENRDTALLEIRAKGLFPRSVSTARDAFNVSGLELVDPRSEKVAGRTASCPNCGRSLKLPPLATGHIFCQSCKKSIRLSDILYDGIIETSFADKVKTRISAFWRSCLGESDR